MVRLVQATLHEVPGRWHARGILLVHHPCLAHHCPAAIERLPLSSAKVLPTEGCMRDVHELALQWGALPLRRGSPFLSRDAPPLKDICSKVMHASFSRGMLLLGRRLLLLCGSIPPVKHTCVNVAHVYFISKATCPSWERASEVRCAYVNIAHAHEISQAWALEGGDTPGSLESLLFTEDTSGPWCCFCSQRFDSETDFWYEKNVLNKTIFKN